MTQNHKTEGERIAELEKAIACLPTRDEIKLIVAEVMREAFLSAGKGAKAVIITLAVVIGSIAVIGGGLKSVLGFIGFHYMK